MAVPTTATLAEVLAEGGVRSAYQPLVDLRTGEVIGHEALARGPEALHTPGDLFAAAAREGLLHELEWACQAAAISGALDAGTPEGWTLFVNVEPSLLGAEPPAHLRSLWRRAASRLRMVVELTERDLVSTPAELLARVDRARADGVGVALDDVGAEPASLALIPLLRPDVVKLDMRLLHERPDRDAGRLAAAVLAYAEESGAAVLAEGIETQDHLDRAVALGAGIGQGWLFARPGPLPEALVAPSRPVPQVTRPGPIHAASPYDALAPSLDVRVAPKQVLLAMSHHLESLALDSAVPPLLFAAFETAERFTPATARRYARYAQQCSLVAALAVGLGPSPVAGVRGAHLRPGDPLADEWSVVVLGPYIAAALVAKDLGDDGPDEQRRFSFAITHDRAKVLLAARALTARVQGRS